MTRYSGAVEDSCEVPRPSKGTRGSWVETQTSCLLPVTGGTDGMGSTPVAGVERVTLVTTMMAITNTAAVEERARVRGGGGVGVTVVVGAAAG